MEVAGCAAALGFGLRAQGATVEVVLSWPSPYGFRADRVLDRRRRAVYALAAPFRRDVLHYQFGLSFLPGRVDAAWARILGRTLVATYYGDDCRLYGIAQAVFPARGGVGDPSRDDTVRRGMERLGRFCHAALVGDLELASYVSPFFRRVYVTPVALHDDPGAESPPPGRSDRLVVLHTPSDPRIKGTDVIRRAVTAASMRAPLELRLVTGVPHSAVQREHRNADLVIDQLNSATPGLVSYEAMRCGVPALCEFDPAALAPFQQEAPLVRVSEQTLADELVALANDPKRRLVLGELGRQYVSRTHAPQRVARAVLAVYAHARSAEPGLYEATADGIRELASELLPTAAASADGAPAADAPAASVGSARRQTP
jgi:hypothetical protein